MWMENTIGLMGTMEETPNEYVLILKARSGLENT